MIRNNRFQDLSKEMIKSPFFGEKEREFWLGKDQYSFAYTNQFPVTKGHVLVLPLREEITVLGLTPEEIKSHWQITQKLIKQLNQYFQPDGYNIGWNIGEVAGQSVGHSHMHIMPRYHQDNEQRGVKAKGGICRLGVGVLNEFYESAELISQEEIESYIKNSKNILFENEDAVVVKAKYGVSEKHLWMILKNTKDSFEEMSENSFALMIDLFKIVANTLKSDGYNIGWNIGDAAGQIAKTPILHIIPRQKGDVENNRGGICRLLPVENSYYQQKSKGKDVKVKRWISLPFKI